MSLRGRTSRVRLQRKRSREILDMMVVSRERRCRGLLAAMFVTLSGFLCAVVASFHLSAVWGEADMAVLRAFTLHPAVPRFLMVYAWLTWHPRDFLAGWWQTWRTLSCSRLGWSAFFSAPTCCGSTTRLVFACFAGNTKLVFVRNVVHSSCFFFSSDMLAH